MTIHTTVKAPQITALLLLILPLAGCLSTGGGGSSTPTLSLSGHVADGYIRNATVCLDLNQNATCDSSEPTVLSGEGGLYQLSDIDETSANQAPLLAEIKPENNPVDEGDGSSPSADPIPLTRPFFLMAPAGHPGFISPLTTLVTLQALSDPTLTIDEAETQIKSALKLDINLYADYLQEKERNPDYALAAHIATAVTSLLTDQYEQILALIKDKEINQDKTTQLALKALIARNIIGALDTLANQVREAGTDPAPDTIQSIASSVASTLPAPSLDQINEIANQIHISDQSTETNLDTLLQSASPYFQLTIDGNVPKLSRYQLSPDMVSVQHCATETDCLTTDASIPDQTFPLQKNYAGYSLKLPDDSRVLLTKGLENPLPADTTLPATLILPTLPDDFCIDTGSKPGKRLILSGIRLGQSLPSPSEITHINTFPEPVWQSQTRLLNHYFTIPAALNDLPKASGPLWPVGACSDHQATCPDDRRPYLAWLNPEHTQWTFCPRTPSPDRPGTYLFKCRTDESGRPYQLHAPAYFGTDNQNWLYLNLPHTPDHVQLWIDTGQDFRVRTYQLKDQPYSFILLDRTLTELLLNQYQDYLTGQRRCSSNGG